MAFTRKKKEGKEAIDSLKKAEYNAAVLREQLEWEREFEKMYGVPPNQAEGMSEEDEKTSRGESFKKPKL